MFAPRQLHKDLRQNIEWNSRNWPVSVLQIGSLKDNWLSLRGDFQNGKMYAFECIYAAISVLPNSCSVILLCAKAISEAI